MRGRDKISNLIQFQIVLSTRICFVCMCRTISKSNCAPHTRPQIKSVSLCSLYDLWLQNLGFGWNLSSVKMGLLEDAIKMNSCLFSVQSPSKGSIWRAAALSALLRISLPRGNPENRNLEIHIRCCSEIQACSTVQKEHSNTLCAADSDFAPDTREVSSIQI